MKATTGSRPRAFAGELAELYAEQCRRQWNYVLALTVAQATNDGNVQPADDREWWERYWLMEARLRYAWRTLEALHRTPNLPLICWNHPPAPEMADREWLRRLPHHQPCEQHPEGWTKACAADRIRALAQHLVRAWEGETE